MDVRNCRCCGKIFNYYGGTQCCPTCMDKLEEIFKQVKEYIYDHPLAGVQEIVNEFDVTVSMVHRWIREERLCFSPDSPVGIPCEGCGINIKSGRYCDKCKSELIHGFSKGLQSKEEPMKKNSSNARMRFI